MVVLSVPALATAASLGLLTGTVRPAYGRLILPFFDTWFSPSPDSPLQQPDILNPVVEVEDVKVPVVLGVMSQCPDALICEATFDKVLSQVGDKVDLSLSFIGT